MGHDGGCQGYSRPIRGAKLLKLLDVVCFVSLGLGCKVRLPFAIEGLFSCHRLSYLSAHESQTNTMIGCLR